MFLSRMWKTLRICGWLSAWRRRRGSTRPKAARIHVFLHRATIIVPLRYLRYLEDSLYLCFLSSMIIEREKSKVKMSSELDFGHCRIDTSEVILHKQPQPDFGQPRIITGSVFGPGVSEKNTFCSVQVKARRGQEKSSSSSS